MPDGSLRRSDDSPIANGLGRLPPVVPAYVDHARAIGPIPFPCTDAMDLSLIDKTLKAAERYAQQGKFEAALTEYRKVLDAHPNDLTVANTIGDLCSRTGRNDEAIRQYQYVAEHFEAGGFRVKSIAMFKKVLKLDPDNEAAALRLAELYARQSLVGEAAQMYAIVAESRRRDGNIRDALKILKKAADLDPTNLKTRLGLAQTYEREGFTAEASETFRSLGAELIRNDGVAEGITHLRHALELKPDSKQALKSIAEAYAQEGNVKSALEVIARSLELDPNDVDLIIILGRTFLNAGQLDKAEATFTRLFKLDNSRYDYLFEVAWAFIDRGELNRPMSIIDRCIEVVLARRHKKKATHLLKAILERDPTNVQALKRLSGIYKSVRERRNLVTTLNTLVQAALAQGMRAEAVVALRQLIEIEPKKAARHQKQLLSIGDDEQPAPPVQQFPEGFESATATAELLRRSETAELHDVNAAARAAASEDSYDSYGDYSTELLEEMVSQHPEFLEARLKLLEELVAQQPAYLEGRVKLKQLYLDGNNPVKAAAQSMEIARHYEQLGDAEMARQFLLDAYDLNPSLNQIAAAAPVAPTGPLTMPPMSPETEAAHDAPTVKLSDILSVEEFEKYFEWEWRRASREPKPLSLLKVIVDRFTTYEDAEGPIASLRCLERVASTLEAELHRAGQLLASNGGEEFFALLPETHPGGAATVADAMRRSVEALAIQHPNGRAITISVGAATAFPYRMTEPFALIESIEKAVTSAQHAGGNRVVTVPLLGG